MDGISEPAGRTWELFEAPGAGHYPFGFGVPVGDARALRFPFVSHALHLGETTQNPSNVLAAEHDHNMEIPYLI